MLRGDGFALTPNDFKRPYDVPQISYWPAEKLNSIEARMSGGGGGWNSFPKNGSDVCSTTISYKGKSDYRYRDIKQTASLGYSYSTAGPDDTAHVTYFTIDIVGACKACKVSNGKNSSINILREATIDVTISGNDESKLYYAENSEVYSNPTVQGYQSTALNLASDVLSLLSLCVDSVSKGLGTAMSIVSFAASKIFKGNADRSCSEGFEYGTSRKGEFAQGMRLLLKVPATYSYTKISIAYYANGESSETESINLNTSFMVRGR